MENEKGEIIRVFSSLPGGHKEKSKIKGEGWKIKKKRNRQKTIQ